MCANRRIVFNPGLRLPLPNKLMKFELYTPVPKVDLFRC